MDALRASLERVLATGEPDAVAIQKYDIPDGDGFAERFWSPVTIPIHGDGGRTVLLLHRVEDVTGERPQDEPAGPERVGGAQHRADGSAR